LKAANETPKTSEKKEEVLKAPESSKPVELNNK